MYSSAALALVLETFQNTRGGGHPEYENDVYNPTLVDGMKEKNDIFIFEEDRCVYQDKHSYIWLQRHF